MHPSSALPPPSIVVPTTVCFSYCAILCNDAQFFHPLGILSSCPFFSCIPFTSHSHYSPQLNATRIVKIKPAIDCKRSSFYPQSHVQGATIHIIMQINGKNEEGFARGILLSGLRPRLYSRNHSILGSRTLLSQRKIKDSSHSKPATTAGLLT